MRQRPHREAASTSAPRAARCATAAGTSSHSYVPIPYSFRIKFGRDHVCPPRRRPPLEVRRARASGSLRSPRSARSSASSSRSRRTSPRASSPPAPSPCGARAVRRVPVRRRRRRDRRLLAPEGGLRRADRAGDRRRPGGARRVAARGGRVASSPPQYSEDGEAALVVAQIVAEGDEQILIDAVDSIRETVADGAPRRPRGEGHRPGRLLGRREQGLRGHQLHAPLHDRAPRLRPPRHHLPQPDLLGASRFLPSSSPRPWCAASGTLLVRCRPRRQRPDGGILLVLVFGAGTDYALLLTARYREELHRHEDKHEAMRIAVRQAGPGILASAGTVVAALLCLSFASVNSTAGLGPVGAMGVAVAATAMLTVLPALLLIGGRRAFWPFVPRFDHPDAERERNGVAARLLGSARRLDRAPASARSGSSRRSRSSRSRSAR